MIDAQRCCCDRLAGGRKTLRQNDWILLFDVSVWLTCDGWLHLQNRSALTVVMTPNISSVISEQSSDNFWWKEYTSVTKLHAIFSYLSVKRRHLFLTGSTFDVITQHDFKIKIYRTVLRRKKKKKEENLRQMMLLIIMGRLKTFLSAKINQGLFLIKFIKCK